MMAADVTLALVGGTGLTELDESLESISIETPFGHPSADIRVIETDPLRLLFLPRHGNPHRFPPQSLWRLAVSRCGHRAVALQ